MPNEKTVLEKAVSYKVRNKGKKNKNKNMFLGFLTIQGQVFQTLRGYLF